MGDMALRFDAYPHAIQLLHAWRLVPAELRPWICHWHTQLADPIYRRFTGEFLPLRREHGYRTVDRDVVARWIQTEFADRWSPVTCLKFGANLLATAHEAGLFKERRDPRTPLSPRVPDTALEYLLYLLREIEFTGNLLENPYLKSIGVEGTERRARFGFLRSVRYRELGNVTELDWAFDSLADWARATYEVAA
jgi:hypothetical protein